MHSVSSCPGTALVTGGSGYIAGFLIRRLLEDGWRVHATVRSRAREAEVRRLIGGNAAEPGNEIGNKSRLTFFTADLTADAGWAEAAAGCTHVAHLASPLPRGVPRDPNELIVPARDGVLRALRAAQAAGVKRFVMTSSVAAIAYGRGRGVHRFTESDWTDLSKPGITPYVQSKTVAERAARDWMAQQGAQPGANGPFEFCAICPSVVLGPVWSADYSASVTIVKTLLDGRVRACPDIGFGIVDVRDVAELHLRALTAPGMAGERFIASGRFVKLVEIAQLLRAELGPQAARVSTRTVPDWLVRVVARFNPVARAVVSELGSVRHQDATHAKEVLGWQTRPVEQSVLDCARSLIENGVVRHAFGTR